MSFNFLIYYYILSEVGIPNLVLIHLWVTEYHILFWVTVTDLTSFLELSCPEHILYIILGRISECSILMHLGVVKCCMSFSGNLD